MLQIGCRRLAPHVQDCPRGSSTAVKQKYEFNAKSNTKSWCRATQKAKRSVCAGSVAHEGSSAGGEDDSAAAAAQEQPLVVVECDGILVDIHNTGHRKAFNLAFEVLCIVAVLPLLICKLMIMLDSSWCAGNGIQLQSLVEACVL